MTTLRAVALTEKQFQGQVVELAKIRHWDVYHAQLAKWSEKGWPDLTLMRPPRLVFAELKSEKGKTTERQRYWLEHLEQCGIEVYLWRPSDWDDVERVLR